MGTPNSTSEDFRVSDLWDSGHQEDEAVAQRANEVVEALVHELAPILRYIVQPFPYSEGDVAECVANQLRAVGTQGRALLVMENPSSPLPGNAGRKEYLFLHDNGTFFTAQRCPSTISPEHYHYRHYHYRQMASGVVRQVTWERYPFSALLRNLRGRLAEAVSKREEHLGKVQQRLNALDEMLAVLRRAKAE